MRVCVLSGGANKGAYQVGILKHLLGNLELKYDLYCGVSVGAINAAYLAMFPDGEEKLSIKNLELLWRDLTTKDIYVSWLNLPKPFYYLSYIVALFNSSLYNSKPLEELVKKHYKQELIFSSGKKLRIGAVNINDGNYHLFSEDDPEIIDAILGSSAFPMAFCPIEINGSVWLDGGIKEITPLKAAIDMGATEIDIIMTSPPEGEVINYKEAPKLLELGPRILDIMSNEILNTDIKRFIEINEFIAKGADIPGKRYIPMNLYRPKKKLVDNSLLFEQEFIRPMIDLGYAQAIKETDG